MWAMKRAKTAEQGAALLDPEAFFRLVRAPQHLAEPEAIVFGNSFLDLLDGQPPETRAVIHLTAQGYQDTEIAEELRSSPGAVRTRRYRFRSTLYQAARDGKIWIPQQFHTAGAPRRTEAAAR
jgi:DNA-directed RNA polymerase specialized sigma24 family protein